VQVHWYFANAIAACENILAELIRQTLAMFVTVSP
jgi:hypothetical protein